MKNFFIKTLGCKTNQIESQLISQNMLENGFTQVLNIKNANYYILNSCSVTSHADSQCRYLLNQAKRKNKGIKTVLCGCLAQADGENIEEADFIFGNHDKFQIGELLDKSQVTDIFEEKEFNYHLLKTTHSTRPSIKIQDGCNNRCAYCIIPYTRGKSRSNTTDNIIEQINTFTKQGIKEIVLTGIHIGLWGEEWEKSIIDLLREIEKTDIERYRLGSLYINEITDELIDFLKKSKKFCPHFHLSLQSMCDKTLKNMNRKYSVSDIFKTVSKLNFKIPTFLGCDIIVGFPNETEEDFKETYNNLEKLGLTKIHVFPYSKRKNTIAPSMPNQINEGIKKERVLKIMNLSEKLYSDFIQKNMNIEHEFLFEKMNKKNNYNCGITRNYIKAYFSDKEDLRYHIEKRLLSSAIEISKD